MANGLHSSQQMVGTLILLEEDQIGGQGWWSQCGNGSYPTVGMAQHVDLELESSSCWVVWWIQLFILIIHELLCTYILLS